MKAVPIEKKFFKQIICDEIHRLKGSVTHKFLVAIESMSGFMVALPIIKEKSGTHFVALVAQLKSMLTPHSSDQLKIGLRCDAATWHNSAEVRETLNLLNVEIQLHDSASLSKNIVPELDGKLKHFSRHLGHYMSTTALHPEICAQLACQKMNTTVGRQNCTPAELFTGRKAFTDESVRISANDLLSSIAHSRESKRTSAERANYQKLRKSEQQKHPYSDPTLNSTASTDHLNLSQLCNGDQVPLNTQFDKNHPERSNWWTVESVDFKNQQAKITQGGQNQNKIVVFSRIKKLKKSKNSVNLVEKWHNDSSSHQNMAGIVVGDPVNNPYFEPDFSSRSKKTLSFRQFLTQSMDLLLRSAQPITVDPYDLLDENLSITSYDSNATDDSQHEHDLQVELEVAIPSSPSTHSESSAPAATIGNRIPSPKASEQNSRSSMLPSLHNPFSLFRRFTANSLDSQPETTNPPNLTGSTTTRPQRRATLNKRPGFYNEDSE